MLGQRIATAAVLLLLIGTALYLGHAAFAALAALFIAMAIFEWLRLAGHRSKAAALGVALFVALLLGFCEWRGVPYPLQLSVAALALAIWLGVLGMLWRVQQGQQASLSKAVSTVFCMLLMTAAWFALMDLSRLGAVLLVSALAVVWVADIAAYFSGRAWGKRKLAALISPGKTWAGVGGAFVGVIGIALIAAQLWPALPLFTTLMLQRFSWPLTMLLLMGLVVLAIAGDLFESLLKRQAGVKDSGATLPGHGGVLDRIDALLPVLPAVLFDPASGRFLKMQSMHTIQQDKAQQNEMQGVSILGATGSIGTSSLDVLARHPQRFRVTALTAGRDVDKLLALCERWRPELAVIADESLQQRLAQGLRARGLSTQAASGAEALVDAARLQSTHVVIAAIVGAAGLPATLAAAQAGKRLLLANKEAVVCAGALLMNAVRMGGAELIPLDSEHSAIAQCLAGSAAPQSDVRRLVLTASGGPFRTRSDLSQVTPQQAIAHPNWVMGRKISVDSATLMNKGLEVIEASWLFGFSAEHIEVVIHPQSVIHSMVEFGDGSVMAQLGTPDMRTPIAYGLGFPQRIESGSDSLNFLTMGTLSFEAPDHARFPCLGLAYRALRDGGQAPIALNAANEIAVDAFLEDRIAFLDIAAVIETTLSAVSSCTPSSIEEVLHIDEQARALARQEVKRRATSAARVGVGVS